MSGGIALPLSPVQARHAARIHRLVADACERGRGRVVFVAGGEASGRSQLLGALARELPAGHRPLLVLGGAFEDGRYVPSAPARPALHGDAEGLVNATVGVGSGLLGPAGMLVEQFVKFSFAAYRVLERLRADARRAEIPELLPRLLREAAGEQPVVCLMDDTDHAASTWWCDLVLSFAQELTEELPIVLVMAVDGPDELDDGDEWAFPTLAVARRLVRRDLAEWHSMIPLTVPALSAWLGPMTPALLTALHTLSGGRHGDVAELWRRWIGRGLIARDASGCWEQVGAIDLTMSEAADRLTTRLRALLGDRGPTAVDTVREALVCAALEGRTFTFDAVADATGIDRDVLLDALDGPLAIAGPEPLISRVSDALVRGRGHSAGAVRRYRFTHALDWRVVRARFASDAERERLARRLAVELLRIYTGQDHRIATTLVALFRLARDEDAAAYYSSILRYGVDRSVLRWQARAVAAADTSSWDAWDFAEAAERILRATDATASHDPYEDSLALVRVAERYARRHGRAG